MSTTAESPTVDAASATACAWLPELTAMTPVGLGWKAASCRIALKAPRTLKEPVT